MKKALSLRVLVIDDDEEDYRILQEMLSEVRLPERRYDTEWVSSYDAGLQAISRREHDVCFLDFRLGARTGLELLKEAIAMGSRTPMILLTGHGEPNVDQEAMKVGAADYLVKDSINPNLIERSIRYSIHRMQMEAQILMQDRLASAGLLASSLAHEIGTPLGVIRGRAEFLALQTREDPEIRKNVDVIVSQIDRVSRLIHLLLNLARGDRTHQSYPVHLNRIVEEVLDLMAHELRVHSIEVQNELTRGLAVAVTAEASPFHQVLLNLLVNSVHAIESATRQGRKEGHFIRISAGESPSAPGYWSVLIQDSGCGISRQNMKNLFKPFFTTKEIGVGTGLGLATSYRIIESWGGSIRAESQEGVGTTFWIELPKARESALPED